MFKNLTDFAYQRNTKEAIGFYLAYLVFIILISVLASIIIAILIGVNKDNASDFGLRLGTFFAVISSFGLGILVLKAKNNLNNFGLLLLVILAGLIAFFLGGLGGLIPVAYLTTKPPLKINS